MATVKMQKGNKYADIFDSPETIAQAQSDGYVLVAESDGKKETDDSDTLEVKETTRRGRQTR